MASFADSIELYHGARRRGCRKMVRQPRGAKGVMRSLLSIVIACAAYAGAMAAAAGTEQVPQSYQQEAREIAQEFVGLLKPQLKRALTEGGPAHAIAVCADVAPAIADALSAQSGWLVRRVSLKSRNASRAIPDAWERGVLEDFDQRQAAGEAAAQLSFGETSGKQYRHMQAQGVEPLCLTCHGQNLSPVVVEALRQYYPDDWATGYALGDVRGAISLSKNF